MVPKRYCWNLCQCPAWVFRSFIVSGLIFRSLIHFEFNFVHGVRECSDFVLWHVAVQFSQHHLLKSCLFSTVYILASKGTCLYSPYKPALWGTEELEEQTEDTQCLSYSSNIYFRTSKHCAMVIQENIGITKRREPYKPFITYICISYCCTFHS